MGWLAGTLLVVGAGCGRIGFDGSPGGGGPAGGADNPTGADGGAALTANLAFVSSMTYAPGALGGPAGADAACNQLAASAGRSGSFVAWISTNTTNAIDRIAGARGWTRVAGPALGDQPSGYL